MLLTKPQVTMRMSRFVHSNSLATKAQAYVAISEMQHSLKENAKKLGEDGLKFLKTYQDENPASEIAVKGEAAIKKLTELGRLRREAAKESWEIV